MNIREFLPGVLTPLIAAGMGVWAMLLVADNSTQMTRESNLATAKIEAHLDWAQQYRGAAVDFMTAALISSVYGPGNEKVAKSSARFAYTLKEVKAFAEAATRLNALTDDNIASQKAVGDAAQEFWYRTVSEINPKSPSMSERDFDETSIFMSATIIELVNVAIAEAEQRTFEEIRSPAM